MWEKTCAFQIGFEKRLTNKTRIFQIGFENALQAIFKYRLDRLVLSVRKNHTLFKLGLKMPYK